MLASAEPAISLFTRGVLIHHGSLSNWLLALAGDRTRPHAIESSCNGITIRCSRRYFSSDGDTIDKCSIQYYD